MNDHLAVRKKLAAIASFRILFDKQKDSYEVLRCFIRNTLAKHSMRLFTVAELLANLEDDFGFGKLPVFVVEKAVKPLTTAHTKNGYTCEELPADESDLSRDLQQSDNDIQNVLDLLYQYVQDKRSIILTDFDKHKLEYDLSNFLLTNKAEDDDSVTISSFVVDNSCNLKVQKTLDEMREGMILYSGLSYSTTKDASDKWKSQLIVFLDTELLFHASGLNGELKKKVFDDFKELVDEVNADSQNKKGRKLIRFKCFDYVYKEVDAVFKNAQDIVEGKAKLAPGKTAQEILIKDVHDPSEIVRKRVDFEDVVKSLDIEDDEEPEGYYHTSTYAFNLEDPQTIESLKGIFIDENRVTDKRIMDSLQSLSYVNVRRKTYVPKDFEQCRYILLTENNTTKRISRAPEVHNQGVVPLCTDLYFFTNRLWTRLGKGFGESTTPSIFSAASKARFIIASKLDMIVTAEYDNLCKEYDAGKLTDDQASSFLYQLKTMAKNPEEIENSDIVDLNLSVNGSRLEQHIQEQALKNAEHQKTVRKLVEQAKVMSRYEVQEANKVFEKELVKYKASRNKAFKLFKSENRQTVNILLMLVVIALLLGIYLKVSGTSLLTALFSSIVPLLPGFIWFLAKEERTSKAFRYVFCRLAKMELKREVISTHAEEYPRPSFNEILSVIKKRNGSNDAG